MNTNVSTNVKDLDPALILADDNSRFSLKKHRIETLAADILEKGGVMVPIEVEPLAQEQGKAKYRVTAGHYRHAAVAKLNAEQNAGLTLPCVIHSIGDVKARLARQVAENVERENQSPMDQAVAIKKLLDAGFTVIEVRNIFKRPGGRKGNAVQPASNSFVNMTLSFLDLPKPIQTKIHEGLVGVAAAYELTKVPIDKREAVLEAAENLRMKEVAREESDEEKFLAAQKKADDARIAIEANKLALEKAKVEQAEAMKAIGEASDIASKLYETKIKAVDDEARKVAEEELKVAEKLRNDAIKAADAKKKETERLAKRVETANTVAAERAKQLKDARDATQNAGKKGAVGPAHVKKAAAAAGTGQTHVALNASEMRKLIEDLTLAGTTPIVKAVAEAIRDAFKGMITDKQLYTKLRVITGEKEEPAKKSAKGKAA